MLIGQWRGYFFLILLEKRAKLLAHDWYWGCLATAYAIEKLLLFSVTMASRFEIVDEEYIEELKDKSENENTRKSMVYWKNVFKKWANERNFQANLEEYESDVLDQTLAQFYAELRKENGDEYFEDLSMSWYLCAKIKFHSAHSCVCGDWFSVNFKWLPMTDY